MKAIEKAQAIYDLTMNERCEAKVQDLFSNGLHKLMIDLIEELEDLENRSCENCKFKYVVDSMCTECRCNESPIDYIDFDCFPFFSCREWKPKNENL